LGLAIAQIRPGDDQTKLAEFRYRVYVEEQGNRPPYADRERRQLRDSLDDVSTSHVILNGDEVVGSLRVTFLEDVPDVGPFIQKLSMGPAIRRFGVGALVLTSRFIIDPSVRHGTVALRMMRSGYEQAMARSVRLNFGDCSPNLLPFYEHMGYRNYASAFNDPAYGFKLPMVMLLRDHEQFTAAGSVLSSLVRDYPDDTEARSWFAGTYPDFVHLQSAQFLPDGSYPRMLEQRGSIGGGRSPDLFYGLESEEIEQLLARAVFFRAQTGDRILRAHDRIDALFLVISGAVRAGLGGDRGALGPTLRAGAVFGNLFDTDVTDTDIIASTACELIVIPGDYLNRLLNKTPSLSEKLRANLTFNPV
jgi:hypothetical protein